jgi:hypothetical protein
MKITLEEMVEVAKRLPIGYYLGRKTPVIVENGSAAYCNTINGEIHIGIGLLQQAAKNIDPSKAKEWDKETLLRCLLYHEIGHLLLTPKWLRHVSVYKPDGTYMCYNEQQAILNIFEDERIEQLLASTFYGVDFKAFCLLVNKNAKQQETFVNKFFDAVRLRKTSPSKSKAIDDAIYNLKDYTTLTSYSPGLYQKTLNELIQKLFEEDEQDEQSKQEQSEQEQSEQEQDEQGQSEQEQEKDENADEGEGQGQSNKSEGDGEEDKDDDSSQGSGGEGEGDGEEENPSSSPSPNGSEEEPTSNPTSEAEEDDENAADEDKKPTGAMGVHSPITSEFLKSLASVVFGDPTQEIQNTLNRFASRLAKKRGTQAAGCWSGLHGRIESKRDAMDKDKIFRRKSDIGDKLMQSVNLTLWVDHSGSFSDSKDKLNQILTAVYKALQMSTGKLNVNVVKMDDYARVATKSNEWAVDPNGDNAINDSYATAWERTRKKDRRNIDIVVFDGACGWIAWRLNCGLSYSKEQLEYEVDIAKKIWNSHDCWVVSDESNRKYFSLAMPKAHITYIKSNYAEHLQAKVMDILDRIL